MLLIGSCLMGQTRKEREQAERYAKTGKELFSSEKYQDALKYFISAAKIAKSEKKYLKDIARTHMAMENHRKAISALKDWIDSGKADEEAYQLTGNAYDMLGEKQKALRSYDAGLEKMPNSGKLYMEKGIVEFYDKQYEEALNHWEYGILAEPEFSGNYYWAAKVYAATDERLWGLIYGEIFMNIERGSELTNEISRLLYSIYSKAVEPGTNPEGVYNFSKFAKEYGNTRMANGVVEPCFEEAYEEIFAEAYIHPGEEVSIAKLHLVRRIFLTLWFNRYERKFPNSLFTWQRELSEQNLLEAYDYWLFFDANDVEFTEWFKENETEYRQFESWFTYHPMPISQKFLVSKLKYEKKLKFNPGN